MSKKYYKPILKEGDHLVRSSKNPERVRGQSRDKDNKNPDIVEWEEVEIEESDPEETREELEKELRIKAYEEERIKQELARSRQNAITAGLEVVKEIAVFLNNHPEVAETIMNGGRKIKNVLLPGLKRVGAGIKNHIFVSKKIKNETSLDESQPSIVVAAEMVQDEDTNIVENQSVVAEDDHEEMSIDEARKIIINILSNYISMKRNIDRLSKARINDANMPQLDMNQVLAYMDSIVERYPALMDEKTLLSVRAVLQNNSNMVENRKFMEVLRIEQ